MERLELDNVSGFYDEEARFLRVTYKETVNTQTTSEVYAWIARLLHEPAIWLAQGSIYDFTAVKTFAVGNMSATQTQSRSLNSKVDMSKHPVALVVGGMYQERMVSSIMHVTPQEKRKRIVNSAEEALAFIQRFHQESRDAEEQSN